MLDVASDEFCQDLARPNLRALRNKFFKSYNQKEDELTAQDLSALLVYFALSFIDKNLSLNKLLGQNSLNNKKLNIVTSEELVFLAGEIVSLISGFVPDNVRDQITAPDKSALLKAREFFKGQENLFSDIANLGFAYQIFSSAKKREEALFALQRANKKISKEELIRFTQLYTPTWVTDFLVANAILSGQSNLKISKRYSRWLMANEKEKREKLDLEKFSVIDPACGAGQFLFSAFDLLLELYEQNGYGIEYAARNILYKNIFAADIDEKAMWVCALGFLSKYIVVSEAKVSLPGQLSNFTCVSASDIEQTINENGFLGSIDNRLPFDHFLKRNYSLIITNPPYVGRRCLSREIKETLKEQYPNSRSDLAAAFLERCLLMLEPDGKLGIITQSSVMSIPSYKQLRNFITANYEIKSAVKCGPGIFPLASGEKIDSVLLVINAGNATSESPQKKLHFIDLSFEKEKALALEKLLSIKADKETNYSATIFPNSAFASGLSNNVLQRIIPDFENKINKWQKLSDLAQVRQGLATTDNKRFVRYHFDVEKEFIGKIWVPYIKGAGAQRYISDNPFVVKWQDNGREIKEAVRVAYPYLKGKVAWVVKNEEFYFRPGLCFSFINKSGLAVRQLPAGAIFDVASSAIFAIPEKQDFLLAYLNSQFASMLAKSINETINIQVGDLKKLPIIETSQLLHTEISRLGKEALETKVALLNCPLIDKSDSKLTAEKLAASLNIYLNSKLSLQRRIDDVQNAIDNKVVESLEWSGVVSTAEKKILLQNLHIFSNDFLAESDINNNLSDKSYAYKILNMLVAQALSDASGERLVLFSPSRENLSQFLNITNGGLLWLENKLGMALKKFFSQRRLLDISKLAGLPSRYFNFYLNNYDFCMFFSSSAARRFKKDLLYGRSAEIEKISSNVDSFEAINKLWQAAFEKLNNIDDWSSKTLISVFNSL